MSDFVKKVLPKNRNRNDLPMKNETQRKYHVINLWGISKEAYKYFQNLNVI